MSRQMLYELFPLSVLLICGLGGDIESEVNRWILGSSEASGGSGGGPGNSIVEVIGKVRQDCSGRNPRRVGV